MNMKKIFNIISILLLTVFTTSCLDSNLEDLDTYKGKDVIGIAVLSSLLWFSNHSRQW